VARLAGMQACAEAPAASSSGCAHAPQEGLPLTDTAGLCLQVPSRVVMLKSGMPGADLLGKPLSQRPAVWRRDDACLHTLRLWPPQAESKRAGYTSVGQLTAACLLLQATPLLHSRQRPWQCRQRLTGTCQRARPCISRRGALRACPLTPSQSSRWGNGGFLSCVLALTPVPVPVPMLALGVGRRAANAVCVRLCCPPKDVYASVTYLDKLSFAAAWLNRATGKAEYLQQAQSYFAQFMADNSTVGTNT